ncbi:hypothetical protein [Pseudomonas paeninsulae]|nr:hypothetical protein [Pseudomonas sp. IT1137]
MRHVIVHSPSQRLSFHVTPDLGQPPRIMGAVYRLDHLLDDYP